jgi:hypothetical protein
MLRVARSELQVFTLQGKQVYRLASLHILDCGMRISDSLFLGICIFYSEVTLPLPLCYTTRLTNLTNRTNVTNATNSTPF